MEKILEAKKHLRQLYRQQEGFVGVGIGQRGNEETLRVYVVDSSFPIARKLSQEGEFEGFPLEIEVTGDVKAY
jgi:hypothetical protein